MSPQNARRALSAWCLACLRQRLLTCSPQCVDITFADPGDERIEKVNESNCFNSQDLGFADIYTITQKAPGQAVNATSGAEVTFWYMRRHDKYSLWRWSGWLPVILGGLYVLL